MPFCHVLYIGYNTPTNHDLAQVQISLDNNVELSFSVLIHKSVENDMGQTSLFVKRSESAVCLIL